MPAPIKVISDFFIGGTPPGGNREPYVMARPDGGFEIFNTGIYTTDTDVAVATYSSLGVYQSNTSLDEASSSFTSAQGSGVTLSDGRQVRVWTQSAEPADANARDIHMEILYPGGLNDVDAMVIAGGVGEQIRPAVAASLSGRFAIAFEDHDGTGNIEVRFYRETGSVLSTRIIPTEPYGNTGESHDGLSLTTLSNGHYVLAYTDSGFNGRFGVYDGAGGVISAEKQITNIGSLSGIPDVVELSNGNILFSYYGNQPGPPSAMATIYTPDGVTKIAEFSVGTSFNTILDQYVASAALADGRFMTVWVNEDREIVGAIHFNDGTPDGAQFAVGTVTTGDQARPSIDVLADGRVVVAWETDEGGGPRIKAAVYDPRVSEGADIVFGTDRDDLLQSFGGDDTLHPGEGEDTVDGGGDSDWVSFSGANQAVTVDLAGGAASGPGIYTLVDIENAEGTSFGDTMTGSNTANALAGGLGDDTLIGNGGNDVLDGGFGTDRLQGGGGGDILNGGDGNDIADYSDASFDVVVTLRTQGVQNTNRGADQLISIERLESGSGNDNLKGTDLANVLSGNTGEDTINGFGGQDTIYGGGTGDLLFGGGGNDLLYGQNGADLIRGNDDNDIIDGGSGEDELFGGEGGDQLFGGTSGDNMFGENGQDTLNGGAGDDTLRGGDGADVFEFSIGNEFDRVRDWEDGVDLIDLSGWWYISAADAAADFVQQGSTVRLINGTDVLVIENEVLANITEDDIIL